MSATIIRIMTSSSTRKTEQPTGRVAIMMESLLFRAPTFAKNTPRRNAGLHRQADCRQTIFQGCNAAREQRFHVGEPKSSGNCSLIAPPLLHPGLAEAQDRRSGLPRDIMSQEPPEKMMFQLNLRRRGISDRAILRAMEEVPREIFVAAVDRAFAYRDS